MLLCLKLMAVYLAALLLLLFGSSNGTTLQMPKHEDLIFYTRPGHNEGFTGYCTDIDIDPATSDCYPDFGRIHLFEWVNFDTFLKNQHHYFVLKHDVVVINPSSTVKFKFDVETFNFPAYCLYFHNVDKLKVLITVQQAYVFDANHDENRYQTYFIDPDDKCREHRYKELDGIVRLNLNLYANRKWNKYAYYFIKKDKYICAYSIKYDDLSRGSFDTAVEIHPVKFDLIDNYPTEYYAPNFFCVDTLYGTFVSLYWDKFNPPEAHYYIINEKDIKNIQLIDRMILTDLDEIVLKAIFNNEFDLDWYPTFTSYGRQIFIWFKLRDEMRAFNGLWKNDKEKTIFYQQIEQHNGLKDLRKLWRAKKSYIQQERPVGSAQAPSTPPPITMLPRKPTTTPKPTTTTTTTRKTTTTTTTTKKTTPKPTTTTTTSTTLSPSTTTTTTTVPTTTAMPTTTTVEVTTPPVSSTTFNDTSFNQSTPSSFVPSMNESQTAQHLGNQAPECSNDDLFLYLLIVLIVIIVFEVILLVILIILKSRGAKKMKAAIPRKKFLKSKSSIKKKPSAKEKSKKKKKKRKMPWTKESKKSIKEKTATSKTEDATAGKTADEKTGTTHQTAAQTNYYTVGETFNKSAKKKIKGKH